MGLSKLMPELIKSFLSFSWKRSWLTLKSFLLFSERPFFLLGLIFTNAMAEYSFLGFLIVFIKKNSEGDNMRLDAVISTAKDCFSAFLASFLVCIAHDRISPFILILVTHAIFITGMLTLLRAPFQTNEVFYLALALLSVNKSGIEYMIEFAGEPAVGDSEQVIDDKKKPNITPIDAWWEIGWIVGIITVLVLISSDISAKQMPMISAIAGAIGCIFFGSYSIRYRVSLGHHQECKHELNHEIRALLKLFPELLPLWIPFLIYYVVDAAGSTFFMEQAKELGYVEAHLYMVQKIVGFMVSNLINYGIRKFSSKRNQPKWVTRVTKITCGMFICFLICLLSWHVEASRLQSIKNNQDPKIIRYVVMFLQFILLGTMNKMVGEMLGKFFCDHADESMYHLEFTFNSMVEGMGRLLAVACIFVFRNWIGNTLNESHLDKYYRALTFISLWACVIFIYLSYTFYWKKETEDHDSLTKKMEEDGLTSEPQSFSLHLWPQWSAHFSADESIFTSSEHSLRSSLQSSAYFSADESHFASSGNSLQSSPQSSAYLSSHESIFASSEQTSLVSNLSSTRPRTNSKCLKSLTCPKGLPPEKEIPNDYRRSQSSPNDLRYLPSAKAISHSQGPSEMN